MADKRPSKRASYTWRRLAQFYGARLADQYGAICPPDWCNAIDRADDERLEVALTAIRRDHLNFPPTLGQFEAAIPHRSFGASALSNPERLVMFAVENRRLCEHQSMMPWTYFGPVLEPDSLRPIYTVRGVTIPECTHDGCFKFGAPNHRILISDLS